MPQQQYIVSNPWLKVWLDTLGYEVNKYTAPIIRCVDQVNPRFMVIYGGERSGKSFNTVAVAGAHLPPNRYPKQRLYWIIGPDFNQCRREFEYLFEIYNQLGLVTRVSMPETPTMRWYMELSTNERWETKSSADIAKL